MKRTFMLLLMFALVLCFRTPAEAKWWIFGQTGNEISTRYLYLNGISYDELGNKVTIYRESLPDGRLILRGKAGTTSSKVGVIQVSLDAKATWQEAKRSDDGTFEYAFIPEKGTSYLMYVKIMDTTGKSNDVEATRKEVVVSEQNISASVRQTLDALIAAYRAEDPRSFMNLVSPNFAADSAILDRAIRKDFSVFDNIDLRYTINNISSGSGGKVFVSLSFARSVTSTKSGKTLTDKGMTEFIFAIEEKGPSVFSMKSPLIFGLSDAENVATGTVSGSEPTITVTVDGTAVLGSVPTVTVAGKVLPSPTGPGTGTSGGSDVVSDLSVLPDQPQSMKHHQITLTFTSDTIPPYTVAVEEATSSSGPWTRLPASGVTLMNQTTVKVMSNAIASQGIFLYYRIIIVKGAVESRPSNVVTWDNR